MYDRVVHLGRWAAIGCLLVYLVACGTPTASTPATTPTTVSYSRTIDLSQTITQDMARLPDEPPTEFVRDPITDTLIALQLNVMRSTHLRLPAANSDDATVRTPSIEQLSPRELLVPAVVLDVRDAAQDNPTYQLRAADIEAWEAIHGPIPADSLVLIATGWDVRWGNPAAYLNLNAQQAGPVPTVGTDALELLQQRAIRGIGFDTPPPLQEAAPPWWQLYNLTRLEQLPPTGTTLLIGALKLQGSHRTPVRAIALVVE